LADKRFSNFLSLDVCVEAIEAAMDAAEEVTKSSTHVDTVDVCVAAIEAAMDVAEEITKSSTHVVTGVVDGPVCAEAKEAVEADDMTKTTEIDFNKSIDEIEERMRNPFIDNEEDEEEADAAISTTSTAVDGLYELAGGAAGYHKRHSYFVKREAAKAAKSSMRETGFVDVPKVEDATSDGEDDWSVLSDGQGGEKSQYATSVLSPVVLAKWDTELHQLHELGFLDDRSNIDSLEHLEAAHMGVDSTDKVTVNSVVEHLLDLA
jgi:hypothetical protein